MSVAVWKKVAAAKAPAWLEIREGRYKTSYRVCFRQGGVHLRQNLEGEFKDWREAERAGEKLIYEAKHGLGKDSAAELVESTCAQLVALKKPPLQAQATYEQTEIFFRVHILPFLRGVCAYESAAEPCRFDSYIEGCTLTSELELALWLKYKAHLRLHRPGVSLFNHAKFWGMLFKFAFDKGILARPVKVDYKKKDDARKPGQIIWNVQLRAFLMHANTTWRRRSIVQRLSGQRPGLIRKLRKDQVDLVSGLTKVLKPDSKNRREYEFRFDEFALRELRLQANRYPDSPYFFPNERDHSRHMDKHLTGWNTAWSEAKAWFELQAAERTAAGDIEGAKAFTAAAARIRLDDDSFTPHDLRHTCLSEIALTTGINPFVEAHTHDLSLAEWTKTYAHLNEKDVGDIKPDGRPRELQIFGTSGPTQTKLERSE